MGYRSDWKIVFNTRKKTDHVVSTIQEYIKNNIGSPNNAESELAHYFRDMMGCISYRDESILELKDTSWKFYMWDEVNITLNEMFDENPDVDFATCRLGEDVDDNDYRFGDYTYVYINRSIGDVDYYPLPEVEDDQSQPVSAVGTCKCDLHQIMRGEGHDDGCPEKDRF